MKCRFGINEFGDMYSDARGEYCYYKDMEALESRLAEKEGECEGLRSINDKTGVHNEIEAEYKDEKLILSKLFGGEGWEIIVYPTLKIELFEITLLQDAPFSHGTYLSVSKAIEEGQSWT